MPPKSSAVIHLKIENKTLRDIASKSRAFVSAINRYLDLSGKSTGLIEEAGILFRMFKTKRKLAQALKNLPKKVRVAK